MAKVSTIQYSGGKSVTTFLDSITNLHTQLAGATAEEDALKISNKILTIFLLPSFPGNRFGNIQDQLFGYLKNLTLHNLLSVQTHPDIAYSVSFLAQFNSWHNETCWSAVKHLLCYFKRTNIFDSSSGPTKPPTPLFKAAAILTMQAKLIQGALQQALCNLYTDLLFRGKAVARNPSRYQPLRQSILL